MDNDLTTAAKRVADAMTMHSVAGMSGHFATFRLSDGRSPDHNTVYDTRIEAVVHAKWDLDHMMYLEITPDGMPQKEAEEALTWWRFLESQGWRYPYPEFDFDGGIPDMKKDRLAMADHLISGQVNNRAWNNGPEGVTNG